MQETSKLAGINGFAHVFEGLARIEDNVGQGSSPWSAFRVPAKFIHNVGNCASLSGSRGQNNGGLVHGTGPFAVVPNFDRLEPGGFTSPHITGRRRMFDINIHDL